MKSLWVKPYLTVAYWRRSVRGLGRSFLGSLGAILLVERAVSLYWPQAAGWLPWWIVISLPSIWAMWECRPIRFVKHRLKGRDVWIGIRIGDIFEIKGSLVVSTNSTFDTSISRGIISPDSLQGQFTSRYYDKEIHLDQDLERALTDQEYEQLDDGRNGKTKKYRIGTVATIRPKEHTVYMVAIADMNEYGGAAGSLDGVVESLAKLWYYIGERGEMQPIVAPVLGTGRARIQIEREEMIREIVGSFIAACSERKFCEEFTIVVSENDYLKHEMDLQEMGNHLRYACRYTNLKGTGDTGGGQAVQ